MSTASIVFQIYLLMTTLLVGSETMHKQECINVSDRLFMIDAYANFMKSNDLYIAFVKQKEECMFNNTPWYHMSLVNISNVSNGTFIPEFDRFKLQTGIDTRGKFK